MTSHPNRGLIRIIRRADDATISVYGKMPATPFAGTRARPHLGLIFCGKVFECVASDPDLGDATFDTEEEALEYFRSIARRSGAN